MKTSSTYIILYIYMNKSSSLVKIISNGMNNFVENKCNKWVKYRNVLPNHKNDNMGSSSIQHYTEIHFHFVDMIDRKRLNIGFSAEPLECSCTCVSLFYT